MSDVQVTQEDREAASQFWADTACLYGTQDKLLAEAFALHRLATRPAPVGEPVAWMHTLHMEGGQTYERLLDHDGTDEYEPSRTGFGIPGRDYSEEYTVTKTPLYTRSALDVETMAARMQEFAIREGWIKEPVEPDQQDSFRALALAAIKDATDAGA